MKQYLGLELFPKRHGIITSKKAASIANVSPETIKYWKRNDRSFQENVLVNDQISASKLKKWLRENKPQINHSSDLIFVKEVAKLLQVSQSTVKRWLVAEGINYYLIGTHGRIQSTGSKAITISDYNKLDEKYKPKDSINSKQAAIIAKVNAEKIRFWCKHWPDFPYDKEVSSGKQIYISESKFREWLEKHEVKNGISTHEAAEIACVNVVTVRRWARKHDDFPAKKDIRNELAILIDKDNYLEWLEKRKS